MKSPWGSESWDFVHEMSLKVQQAQLFDGKLYTIQLKSIALNACIRMCKKKKYIYIYR